ncbi:UDP-N-acetylmuramoyl-L-alanyl-D-glutamate--2,6-diaminopimelate ligase [Planococcus halotolerans]|uniref:UDP-N-acetylmuramoyl-L-alanyl-D-glutamate--2, 6-diaminopimelate ligase n=1 Tax=Planococcus halotolerans TaxID=2233542 RepID=A0A365KRN4_9BACL|nr:UDP-N-acetylmuramoyl-L-alanyl-D-glutamate--2,6-diaminopimelate ligase [Planococcus halotolerans]QHJ69359.1 UDP-N-acetylmuramoyl-L-alanyl-D-glutamate--2,6-diaminopimelate ligase [Planococcus halotolerans]RAZ75659.1 UDP-N-acetylmuramoyl-L-alanyl-D-glutamate--2,6-diaminopimelate ligase [Planococcus halotolerans]
MNIQFTEIPHLTSLSLNGPKVQEITSIVYNSVETKQGSAFFCVTGENTDGHLYIEEAIDKGACAIIGTDKDMLNQHFNLFPQVTFLQVENSKVAMAHISNYFYGNSQDRLIKVGVTGTNGKTTTATFVYSLFNLLEMPCGFLGTTGIWSSTGKLAYKKSTPTTPISSDIHNIFSQLSAQGDVSAAMEVSSIALDQKRVEGIIFDVAIHTNISEEHMEYHKTFTHYLQSKLELFRQAKSAVINLDDAGMSQEILEIAQYPCLTYSADPDSGADLIWGDCRTLDEGLAFNLIYGGIARRVQVPIFGEYNAGNLTAAIAAALLAGKSIEEILAVLPELPQVEGRFQVLAGPEGRKIILDYAHTPVAIELVLNEAKKLPHRRLIAMIAGIGIRDFSKMPKMAKAAEGRADTIIVTVDHPGYNDPNDVVDAVVKGFTVPYKQEVLTAPLRKDAVIEALKASGPEDIILLSSGCINGAQIIKGEYIPHSDEEIIEEFFMQQRH